MLQHLELTTGECLALARAARSTLTEAADRFDDKVRVTAERIGSLPGWTNLDIQCEDHIVYNINKSDDALLRFRRDKADSLSVVVEPPSRHLPEADERYHRR